MAHTPGPHTLKHHPGVELTGEERLWAEQVEECEPYDLACVHIPESGFECVVDDRQPGRYERAVADGRLYAAAPDLLAACKKFVRKVECGEARSRRSYAEMKAAIAKAGPPETA